MDHLRSAATMLQSRRLLISGTHADEPQPRLCRRPYNFLESSSFEAALSSIDSTKKLLQLPVPRPRVPAAACFLLKLLAFL
jgi:hypothetical protein